MQFDTTYFTMLIDFRKFQTCLLMISQYCDITCSKIRTSSNFWIQFHNFVGVHEIKQVWTRLFQIFQAKMKLGICNWHFMHYEIIILLSNHYTLHIEFWFMKIKFELVWIVLYNVANHFEHGFHNIMKSIWTSLDIS